MQVDLDFLQSKRFEDLQAKAAKIENENEAKRFLVGLAREIVNALSTITVSNIENGVNVNNLDEIKASLRNELLRANKPISDILNTLNLSTQEQTDFLKEVQRKADEEVDDTVQTVVVRKVKEKVEISNLTDLVFPSEIKVNNLSDLESYFLSLIDKISALKLDVNVSAPQITVQPTPITIPEQVVNIPAVDLEPIILALERNLKLLRSNNKSNPLAVRITDGADWVNELRKQAAQTQQFMSDVSYIKNATGQRINPATDESVSAPTTIGDNSKDVTTAGTRVQLVATATPCRYVVVTAKAANTDTIWVGGSTVAAGRGRPLVSLQAEKIDINDVSKIWIDSVVNAEGVTFFYVA